MAPRRSTDRTRLPEGTAFRADAALLARLDALAEVLSQPGIEITRSGAIRAAIHRGLEVVEREGIGALEGAAPGTPPAPGSRRRS
jgi:hypothetical protein